MKPLLSGRPDEVDLELLRLGELSDADAAAVQQAADADLQDVAAELEAFHAYWQANRPPLMPHATPTSTRSWVWPAVVLAACALLAVAVGGWWRAGTPEVEVRVMGALPVDVWVVGHPTPWSQAVLEEGDELALAVHAPLDGTVTVFTLQADGQVTPLYEGRVQASERFELPGAVRLDDYGSREWLIVELQPNHQPRDAPAPAALLPDPTAWSGPGRWVGEITRGRR